MIEIRGQFNTAICYTQQLETAAAEQIKAVCDQEAFASSKIRIMPDVHAGKGCTIGTTMTIVDKIVPGMVGVDIGCGMETVRIAQRKISFSQLDDLIRSAIPSGRQIRNIPHPLNDQIDLTALRCSAHVDLRRAQCSIGTLGGGNHFIEVDRSDNGDLFIVVHSGSRHLGTEVATYYQHKAQQMISNSASFSLADEIERMKREGKAQEIQQFIEELKQAGYATAAIPRDLCYVEGQLFDDYIHDMKIVQHFAALNRKAMVDVILSGMKLRATEQFTTIHNYIDTEHMILRKGSVSAQAGEKLLIPINMRDGSLVCIGKGNDEWNCSAPHGAGRLMSRKAALSSLSMEEYRSEMAGIYTTCIDRATLDEAPMAYKSLEEIVAQIGPTAEIVERIKPVYNFKAAD